MMFSWQRLLLCNVPREGGRDANDAASGNDAPGIGTNPDVSGRGELSGPGLGLNDSFGNSPASTVNDVSSSFSNAPDKAQGFDAQNAAAAAQNAAALSDIGNLGSQAAQSTANQNAAAQSQANANEVTAQEIADASDKDKAKAEMQAISEAKASREAQEMSEKASKEAVDKALAGLVEAPAAIGVNPSTTPTSSPSTTPSSTAAIGATTGKSTEVSPPSSTPTANSSTTKGPGIDFTGISLVDSFLSGLVNNPVASLTGLAVGAVNPVAGAINAISGNPIGMGVSGLLGTGYGNTVTSSTNPNETTNPNGPNPSTTDLGPSGSGGITDIPIKPTATTLASYDLTNDKG